MCPVLSQGTGVARLNTLRYTHTNIKGKGAIYQMHDVPGVHPDPVRVVVASFDAHIMNFNEVRTWYDSDPVCRPCRFPGYEPQNSNTIILRTINTFSIELKSN